MNRTAPGASFVPGQLARLELSRIERTGTRPSPRPASAHDANMEHIETEFRSVLQKYMQAAPEKCIEIIQQHVPSASRQNCRPLGQSFHSPRLSPGRSPRWSPRPGSNGMQHYLSPRLDHSVEDMSDTYSIHAVYDRLDVGMHAGKRSDFQHTDRTSVPDFPHHLRAAGSGSCSSVLSDSCTSSRMAEVEEHESDGNSLDERWDRHAWDVQHKIWVEEQACRSTDIGEDGSESADWADAVAKIDQQEAILKAWGCHRSKEEESTPVFEQHGTQLISGTAEERTMLIPKLQRTTLTPQERRSLRHEMEKKSLLSDAEQKLITPKAKSSLLSASLQNLLASVAESGNVPGKS